MKKIILISIILSTFISGYSQFIYNKYGNNDIYGNCISDAVVKNLKGKVKKVSKLTYDAQELNGEPTKVKFSYPYHIGSIYNFDLKGNITGIFKFTDSLDLSKSTQEDESIFEYNTNNKTIKVIEKDLDDNSIDKTHSFEYGKDGKLSVLTTLKGNGDLYYSCVYKYDKKSQLLTSYKSKNSDSKSSYKFEYKKHDNGNLECAKYDNGNADDIILFNKDGKVAQLKEHRSRIISRSPMRTQAYYDTEISEYNTQGDIVYLESKKGDLLAKKQAVHTYQYKYDEKNNWIVKIGYKNDKVSYIVEREIEYFE